MKKYLFCLILIFFINTSANSAAYHQNRTYTRARIIKIELKSLSKDKNQRLIERHIHLKILDGKFKGQNKIALFRGEDNLPVNIQYKIGNVVFIGISQNTNLTNSVGYVSIYDIDNTWGIIILAFLLLTAVIFVGRWKGIMSLVALIITILMLFFIFIPLTLKGYPPLPIAIFISIISIIITLPVIAGFNIKTLAAICGASAGIIISSLLAIIFGWFMHLSGIITDSMLTVFYASDISIDLKNLALSSMIIAALGAIMDVSISIASSASELYKINPGLKSGEAFKSVMTIGKDILGTMVNTLILAYVGSSLALIILISLRFEDGMPYSMILNYNPVLCEIVKSVVGSIGMFLCIPITAFFAISFLHKHYQKNSKK